MRRSRNLHRPWVYPPVTDAGYARWLERQATDEFEGFLILRRSDDQLVGMCNLSQIVREPLQGAYIGFGAVEGFAGRGYMRAGVGLVLGEAFGRLRLHRVEANVQPGNEASKGLVRAPGLRPRGLLRALPEGRRALARPRALGAARRELAGDAQCRFGGVTRTAAVVGAGIGGLAAGIALRKAGCDVTVYERADELRPLGAGLSIWPNGVRALRSLGSGPWWTRRRAPAERCAAPTARCSPNSPRT